MSVFGWLLPTLIGMTAASTYAWWRMLRSRWRTPAGRLVSLALLASAAGLFASMPIAQFFGLVLLGWVLFVAVAALYGLQATVRRWPRSSAGVLLALCAITACAISAMLRDFSLRALPAVVHDGKVLYRNEFDSSVPFFPLPGDNETGVIVYSISADDAAALERSIAAAAPTSQGIPTRDGRHDFYDWRRTPASLWHDERAQDARLQGIAPFLNQYGFGITLEPWVESLINVILSREGGYIARSRVGLLIFSPSRQRIIYTYAG